MKRVFLFVLDSCGCGEMPDAEKFGDHGVNTLKTISSSPFFSARNILKLGLGNIPGVDYLDADLSFVGRVARLEELSAGKDTTIGHWEIAGLVSTKPLPTYPNGFPPEVITAFEKATGRSVICNLPYSGTAVIAEYGEQHLKTGDLIVYTSADSVFQIAAHEDIVPVETLYEYCRKARQILQGEHGVGRVIARPFAGKAPEFYRTAMRRDFSIEPPAQTMLDAISAAGQTVYSIGKIRDIFAGRGVTKAVLTHSNDEGMQAALAAQKQSFEGLCFINLVDFDMLYGHRRDTDGYAKACAAFDAFLPEFIKGMDEEDLLMITADHGCDTAYTESTDHTREYVPLIVYGKKLKPASLGDLKGFGHIASSAVSYLGVDYSCPFRSVL